MKATLAFLVLMASVSAFAGQNKTIVCNAEEPGGREATVIRMVMKSEGKVKAFIHIPENNVTYPVPAVALKSGEDTQVIISAFHSEFSMILPKAIFNSENRNQPMTVMLDNGNVDLQKMICIGKR